MIDSKMLPLLLSAEVTKDSAEPATLDRIRMQKAIFLAVKRGPEAWRDSYEYRPYNWGPYSDTLSRTLGELFADGLLDREVSSRSQYGAYMATARGEQLASNAWDSLNDRERTFLKSVRSYASKSSFNKLLREVYAAFPEYATASQFRG